VFLLAYILYNNRNGRTTITFDELLEEANNIGKIFNLNKEKLLEQIYALRDAGLVKYVQTADLQHIVYTYQEATLKLLDKHYG
jgi:transcription initiation factor IIE alpha subunit